MSAEPAHDQPAARGVHRGAGSPEECEEHCPGAHAVRLGASKPNRPGQPQPHRDGEALAVPVSESPPRDERDHQSERRRRHQGPALGQAESFGPAQEGQEKWQTEHQA